MKNVVLGFPRRRSNTRLTPPPPDHSRVPQHQGRGHIPADANANTLTFNCYHQTELFAKSMFGEYLNLGECIFLHTEPPETWYFAMICRKQSNVAQLSCCSICWNPQRAAIACLSPPETGSEERSFVPEQLPNSVLYRNGLDKLVLLSKALSNIHSLRLSKSPLYMSANSRRVNRLSTLLLLVGRQLLYLL